MRRACGVMDHCLELAVHRVRLGGLEFGLVAELAAELACCHCSELDHSAGLDQTAEWACCRWSEPAHCQLVGYLDLDQMKACRQTEVVPMILDLAIDLGLEMVLLSVSARIQDQVEAMAQMKALGPVQVQAQGSGAHHR